jgi:hypothetical protein
MAAMTARSRSTTATGVARPSFWLALSTGAPLDIIKSGAAIAMVVGHVNTLVLLSRAEGLAWQISRLAFPLFCFAVALNLLRGADLLRYVTALALLALASQPVHAFAFHWYGVGNVVFTLGLGALIAVAMQTWPAPLQHAAFAAAALLTLLYPPGAFTGLDFGLTGLLLPSACLLVARGERAHAPWLAVLLLALNWNVTRPLWSLSVVLLDGVFALAGSLAVLLVAARFADRPRFLARYALAVFYPAHLLVLGLLHRLVL